MLKWWGIFSHSNVEPKQSPHPGYRENRRLLWVSAMELVIGLATLGLEFVFCLRVLQEYIQMSGKIHPSRSL